MSEDKRTFEQIKEHYDIEKELAKRLINSSKEERRHLYSSLYDKLFKKVPLHPQLAQKDSSELSKKSVSLQMKLLRKFLKKDVVFMEIGPGDCALSLEVTNYVKKVYAIDVSKEITNNKEIPANFELILSDGSSISIDDKSIDVAYSMQLMEHLHPDDAYEQLKNIYNVLKDGGFYLCLTPNKFSGPHDVSKYFDKISTGFHLKEYSVTELNNLFNAVGFKKINIYIGAKGLYIKCPLFLIKLLENILNSLPWELGYKIAKIPIIRCILGIKILGIK